MESTCSRHTRTYARREKQRLIRTYVYSKTRNASPRVTGGFPEKQLFCSRGQLKCDRQGLSSFRTGNDYIRNYGVFIITININIII